MNTAEQKTQGGNPGQGGGQGHNTVPISIDKKPYKTPTPTTGSALYTLGGVDTTQYDLWLEVHGKGDDRLIANDETSIDVKEGSQFYTAQKNLNPGS